MVDKIASPVFGCGCPADTRTLYTREPMVCTKVVIWYKIASPVFGEAMVCGELFYLIAADGAYIKNAAAVFPENRLDHFFIIR